MGKLIIAKNCIYCGDPIHGVRRGEHVVPECLGGTRTIKTVCTNCNTTVLSELDKMLGEFSPLMLVARQELNKTGSSVWDYNKQINTALEAYISKEGAPTLWPQLVFKENSIHFFGDLEELKIYGMEASCQRFLQFARSAKATLFRRRRPRWIWDWVKSPPRLGEFPPRIFTKHPISELSHKIHFICRYTKKVDKAHVLRKLETWNPNERQLKKGEFLGTDKPEGQCSFNDRSILRALVKLGINLLEYVKTNTIVSKETFPDSIAFVRNDKGSGPLNAQCGFVVNRDIQYIDCPPKSHKFFLEYEYPNWTLDCSFFGGRVGATVFFPGISKEDWKRVEVAVLLRSDDWQVQRFRTILPKRCKRIEWRDISRIIPSVPLHNLQSSIRIERKNV